MPEKDAGDEFFLNELMLAAQLALDAGVAAPVVQVLWTRLSAFSGQFDVLGAMGATLGPVDRLLGLLASRRGDHETARSLLLKSLGLTRNMHAATWEVWVGDALAAELWRRRKVKEARQVTSDIAPLAVRLGMLATRPSLQSSCI